MAADELGGGVDYDIRAVLDGADQVRGAEGIVDDKGQTVGVGDFGDGIDVGDVAVGIAQGLQIDGFRVGPDGAFQLFQVMGIHEGGRDAVMGQSMGQQVVAAPVDCLLGYNMAAVLGQGQDGICNGRRAGSQGQSRHTAFQGRQSLLQHVLGGIGQAAVDIPGIRQIEAGRRVGGIPEDIGSGLVDGHRPGIRGRVGLLLSYV